MTGADLPQCNVAICVDDVDSGNVTAVNNGARAIAKLGEMKVAPVSAEMVAGSAPLPEARRDDDLPTASIPKAPTPKVAKRAEAR